MDAFDSLKRVILPEERFRSENIAPGFPLQQFHPGGKEGPSGEGNFVAPGGRVDRITAGANGAHLLELARTTAGAERIPA